MNARRRESIAYGLPLAVVTVLILAADHAGIDPPVTRWFYDAQSGGFPLRYDGFVEVVLHHGAKYVVLLVAVAAYAGFAISYLSPQLQPQRRQFLFVALALTLAPLAVASLKLISMRHCPWDVAGFGGYVPYVGLLDTYPTGVAPGHCFPAGHASTGFCLFAFHFLGRMRGHALLAGGGFALGLVAGFGLGLVRVMQGAHFATHVLWSGVMCWVVIALLYFAFFAPRADTRPPIPARAGN